MHQSSKLRQTDIHWGVRRGMRVPMTLSDPLLTCVRSHIPFRSSFYNIICFFCFPLALLYCTISFLPLPLVCIIYNTFVHNSAPCSEMSVYLHWSRIIDYCSYWHLFLRSYQEYKFHICITVKAAYYLTSRHTFTWGCEVKAERGARGQLTCVTLWRPSM